MTDLSTLAIVLVIHGGGFIHGTAADDQPTVDWFHSQGIAARTVEYRTTRPSDGLTDVLREVRREARRRRVFVIGYSAGGTFALRAAQTGLPEAVAAVAPPTRLGTWALPPVWDDINRALTPYQRRVINPWNRCREGTSRTMIVHGDADPLVPFRDSVRYAQRRRCNAAVVRRPGETHFQITVRPAWDWLAKKARAA